MSSGNLSRFVFKNWHCILVWAAFILDQVNAARYLDRIGSGCKAENLFAPMVIGSWQKIAVKR